jgi:CDGSH-type Zn-finger protein
MDKPNETKQQTGIWKGWTTSAFIGTDEFGDPKYARRRFYRCSICRCGTVIKSNYCSNCGAKMGSE